MTSVLPTVVLRREKRGTFYARHPWVLGKSVQTTANSPQDGQPVDLVLPDGQWIARGLYNSRSRIRVRLYSWDPGETLDAGFWEQRLLRAIELRQTLGLPGPSRATRLVFSEADRLSGLIVDDYAGHLVVQLTALGMQARLPLVLDTLTRHLSPASIRVRIEPRVARAEGLEPLDRCDHGDSPPETVLIEEHGVHYELDLAGGQKTGSYLDQRDNRRRAADFCRGRRVLDVCCYLGGFALTCARNGDPREVLGIDSSQWAVERARRHAVDNGLDRVRFEVGDCFEALQSLSNRGEKFGLIVLDPPRFAGSRHALTHALQAYHRLNRLAFDCLEPGGFLVTCSCSGLVTRDDFVHMLAGVAQKTRRDLQVLDQRGAAADHPVLSSCPETEYLKCIIGRVL